MHKRYALRKDSDQTWSVIHTETGQPLRLAGIVQTGLTAIEADVMMELLGPRGARTGPAPGVPATPGGEGVRPGGLQGPIHDVFRSGGFR